MVGVEHRSVLCVACPLNRYAYVVNNPTNLIDPLGLSWLDVLKGIFDSDEPGGRARPGSPLYADVALEPHVEASLKGKPRLEKKKDCEKVCSQPLPPAATAPPGVNINANIEAASQMWNPFDFERTVQPGGPWDFKYAFRHAPSGGQQYREFGNFNYGASCLGVPLTWKGLCLAEAGRASVRGYEAEGKPVPQGWGQPGPRGLPILGTPPYGDNPAEQQEIMRGMDYYRAYSAKKACGCL